MMMMMMIQSACFFAPCDIFQRPEEEGRSATAAVASIDDTAEVGHYAGESDFYRMTCRMEGGVTTITRLFTAVIYPASNCSRSLVSRVQKVWQLTTLSPHESSPSVFDVARINVFFPSALGKVFFL